jgi:hypothetical protein
MGILSSLLLIACGVLAAAPFIVKKKPEAKQIIDKMVPYQGTGGVVLCVWGLFSIIRLLLNVGTLMRASRLLASLNASGMGNLWFYWVTLLVIAVVSVALGFLLGFALISKYVLSKNEEAAKKGEQLREKLAKIQIPLGMAGIVLGLWGLIARIALV